MTSVGDITCLMDAMHLADANERITPDMEIGQRLKGSPAETELDDEMDITLSEGERKTYELYVDSRSDDVAEAMEIYLSLMSDVVGGHKNAMAILSDNVHTMNCFVVNLTRGELEKLVEVDNGKIRGIYPPYKLV